MNAEHASTPHHRSYQSPVGWIGKGSDRQAYGSRGRYGGGAGALAGLSVASGGRGGFSTGPRTPEGKARTVAAMVDGRRRLLGKLKAEGKPVPWGRKRGGVNRSAVERQLAGLPSYKPERAATWKHFSPRNFGGSIVRPGRW
jgi:hypothetical protein